VEDAETRLTSLLRGSERGKGSAVEVEAFEEPLIGVPTPDRHNPPHGTAVDPAPPSEGFTHLGFVIPPKVRKIMR